MLRRSPSLRRIRSARQTPSRPAGRVSDGVTEPRLGSPSSPKIPSMADAAHTHSSAWPFSMSSSEVWDIRALRHHRHETIRGAELVRHARLRGGAVALGMRRRWCAGRTENVHLLRLLLHGRHLAGVEQPDQRVRKNRGGRACAAQTGPGPGASALGQGHRAALPCARVPWVRAQSRSLGFCAPARPSCRAPSACRGRGWWRVVAATWPAVYRPLACRKARGAAQPLVSAGARQGERRRRLCGRSSRREQRDSILWRDSISGAMGSLLLLPLSTLPNAAEMRAVLHSRRIIR
jgi:hypothetical protein